VKGWAKVFSGPNYAAEVVHAALEAAGYRSEVLTDTGHLWPGLNAEDTRVFVPEEQAEEALKMIEADFPAEPSGWG
jgi:hypothetical protein